MTQALTHRGPDAHGIFLDGPIALGHRRLSIIDLESGAQPMASYSGDAILSYNGEIYNYRDLRHNLLSEGYPFKTKSDTEVILALYEKHGIHFLDYLSGMFAFALWDRREHKLILARDRIGIKPLYFARIDGRTYFASEIKAIRMAAPYLNELNAESINSYFSRQYVGGQETMFKGIQKLQPATVLEITADKQSERRYWQPHPDRQTVLELSKAVDQLDEIFNQAVKSHLISDVPLGVFLSGGVDSSCLLAYAAKNSQEPLNTFSVGFEEGSKFNEIEYARTLAQQLNTHHHEIQVTGAEVLQVLPFIVKNLDEPLADYAILPTYIMSRFAAEKVKVVLSGEGADELFGGYKRYHLYAFYDALKRFAPKVALGRKQLPGPALFNNEERKFLLKNFYVESSDLKAENKMLTDKSYFDKAGYLNSMLYTDLKNWLVDDLLMKVDKMGMLASLEARVPYLDQKVVEFVLSLAGKLKVGLKEKKRLLKTMARPYIPIEILQRPKHGFTVPVSDWIKSPLKRTFEDIVFDGTPRFNFINKSYVEQLVKLHLRGKKLGFKLWSIFIFCWWAEENLT